MSADADVCDLLCLDLPHAEEVRAELAASRSTERVLAERARALADGTRLRVARALSVGGELCVCDLAWVCELSQNTTSHHARQLRNTGLANSRRDGKLVMYRLTPLGAAMLAQLLDDDPVKA